MFKEGDRVYWSGNNTNPPDFGVIVKSGDSIYYTAQRVWVKLDLDGEVLHIHQSCIALVELEAKESSTPELTEEQAVMFLLSKGYQISKVA